MPAAESRPSVLLLDDGELDRVKRTLEQLGAGVLRLQGEEIGPRVPCPRDLLVASARRCLAMPELEPAPGASPRRVCVHSQDFLPLRERLRDAGVHFLVHSSLDDESLRLFALQMLYSGPERRRGLRVPIGTDAFLVLDGNRKPVRLAELSAESCRIVSRFAIDELAPVELVLCGESAGGEELELEGVAIRTASGSSSRGARLYSTVVCLESQGADTRAVLERIVGGGSTGTPVTPLSRPGATEPRAERRRSRRHAYSRRVEIIELCDSATRGSALGRDLSRTGIRVHGYPEMQPGAEVTLALYGGRREEPVLVRAEVVRGSASDASPGSAAPDVSEEVAFRFGPLSESQQRGIEKMLASEPVLASVDAGERVVLTRVVDLDA